MLKTAICAAALSPTLILLGYDFDRIGVVDFAFLAIFDVLMAALIIFLHGPEAKYRLLLFSMAGHVAIRPGMDKVSCYPNTYGCEFNGLYVLAGLLGIVLSYMVLIIWRRMWASIILSAIVGFLPIAAPREIIRQELAGRQFGIEDDVYFTKIVGNRIYAVKPNEGQFSSSIPFYAYEYTRIEGQYIRTDTESISTFHGGTLGAEHFFPPWPVYCLYMSNSPQCRN